MASSAASRESSSVSVCEADSVLVLYLSLMVLCLYNFLPYWTFFFLVRSETLLTSVSIVTKICELLFKLLPPSFWFCAMHQKVDCECETFQSVLTSFK